tara:strand:- start:23916 stop:24788 length:873 start_codon:yes stop_codon:yes gene_type:complete
MTKILTNEESKILVTPIKSQGKKTKLVEWIKETMNDMDIKNDTFIEPFVGTGAVGFNLDFGKAIFSDNNMHLINFYNDLKFNNINAQIVKEFLYENGKILKESKDGNYYYDVRNRFNKNPNSLDFLFLSRAAFNGMMRFNKKGGFNVPFCKKPERYSQTMITKISNQVFWLQNKIRNNDWVFKVSDFRSILNENKNKKNVIYYLDAPYILRHGDYYNAWTEEDELDLYTLLKKQEGKFVLSTWYGNKHRNNPYIQNFWKDFEIKTTEHTYHVGAKEVNRNKIIEALVLKK